MFNHSYKHQRGGGVLVRMLKSSLKIMIFFAFQLKVYSLCSMKLKEFTLVVLNRYYLKLKCDELPWLVNDAEPVQLSTVPN